MFSCVIIFCIIFALSSFVLHCTVKICNRDCILSIIFSWTSHIECAKNVGGTPKKDLLWKQLPPYTFHGPGICISTVFEAIVGAAATTETRKKYLGSPNLQLQLIVRINFINASSHGAAQATHPSICAPIFTWII